MLSRSQARIFFLGGTFLASAAFIWLTIDSFVRLPEITHADQLTPQVVRGKHLWDESNCMGCHTLLGEGGYYAPELTRVYERRGPAFIRAMLENPQAMYPGQRQMVRYDFTDSEIDDLIAFFQWIGQMDLNGFPPEPVLFGVAMPGSGEAVVERDDRPQVFNQMCIACHSLDGQGGDVGPALDGVGDRMSQHELEVWLDNPGAVRPGTAMPDLPLSNAQISELAAFLSTLGAAEPEPVPTDQALAADGGVPTPEDAGPGEVQVEPADSTSPEIEEAE